MADQQPMEAAVPCCLQPHCSPLQYPPKAPGFGVDCSLTCTIHISCSSSQLVKWGMCCKLWPGKQPGTGQQTEHGCHRGTAGCSAGTSLSQVQRGLREGKKQTTQNRVFRKVDFVFPHKTPANSHVLSLSEINRKNNLLWEVMGLLQKLSRCPEVVKGLQQKPTITSQRDQRTAAHLFISTSPTRNDRLFGKHRRCPEILMQTDVANCWLGQH